MSHDDVKMKDFNDAMEKFKCDDFQAWLEKNQERRDIDEFLKCVSEAFDLTNPFQANSFKLFPKLVNDMYNVFFNDSTELKPCPFCGSKAEVFVTDTDQVYGDTWYFLGCVNSLSNGADHNCIGSCLSHVEERDLREKVDLWNKRK